MTGRSFSKPATGYLLSPVLDFFMLGGGALLCLLLFMLLVSDEQSIRPQVWIASLIAAQFINNPHFAHSYQLFYQRFREKLTDSSYPLSLRLRYWWAGVVFPVLALLFFLTCLIGKFYLLLGWAANAMFFLVGWHYVKQGYGVLIVLSVKEKIFLSMAEKKALLINSYAVWIASYLLVNRSLEQADYLGVQYLTFQPPQMLMIAAIIVMAATSIYSVVLLARRFMRKEGMPPLNGLIAYVSSGYIWLFLNHVSPVFFLLVPAFHSLQYLPFVWRYKLSEYRQQQNPRYPLAIRLALFLSAAFLMGVLGFYAIPKLLAGTIAYDTQLFGATVFLFMCWTFINIHHYFIDNAIWRKENRDVQSYLFAH